MLFPMPYTPTASMPIISFIEATGVAYPGDPITVSAGFSSFQWYVDGVARAGETANAFTPGVDDVGKTIKVKADSIDSNELIVWHPSNEAGIDLTYLANLGALNNSDTVAADGETVKTWQDQTPLPTNHAAVNSDPAKQPILIENANGTNNALRFDGVNNQMAIPIGARGLFNAVPVGYMFLAVRDIEDGGGPSIHPLVHFSIGTNGNTNRFSLYSKVSGTSSFDTRSRRNDSDNASFVSTGYTAGWNVVGGVANWAAGQNEIRVNGLATQGAQLDLGITEATDSAVAVIANQGGFFSNLDIAGIVIGSGNTDLSSSAKSRIERYLGLLCGKDLALV